jgi:condensin-2 complex subunit H2
LFCFACIFLLTFIQNIPSLAHTSGSSDGGQTFEELCRAHIQAFAKSAEKYALTTKLTERISQWQAHLAPILEEEERKASFDIHRYSEMLLESAMASSEENKKKRKQSFGGGDDGGNNEQKQLLDFEIVTRGCTQSDICRMFLASLSLANSGNLKIEEGMDGYQFEIVSDKVENPMETYRAPSTIE